MFMYMQFSCLLMIWDRLSDHWQLTLLIYLMMICLIFRRDAMLFCLFRSTVENMPLLLFMQEFSYGS